MAFPSAALFLLLYSSGRLTQAVGQGQGSDQRFHGGFGRLLLKCWCISHAFAPTVHSFYYFLSTQVIILDLPLFVPNSHWESLIVYIMTTFAGVFLLLFPLYLRSPLISCGDRLRISWVIYCHSSKRTHILGTAGLLCFQKTLLCQSTSIQAKVKVNVLTSSVSLLHLLNNGSHHTQLSHFLESFQFQCFFFPLAKYWTLHPRAFLRFMKPLMSCRTLKQDRCVCFKSFIM